jgi:type IV pilus assembly protein PilB
MLPLPSIISDSVLALIEKQGVLSEADIQGAKSGCPDGEPGTSTGVLSCLISKGLLDEERLADLLGQLYGLKRIRPNRAEVDPQAFEILDSRFMREHQVVPIALTDNDVIKVAIADPSKLSEMANIRLAAKRNVETYICTFSELRQFIEDVPLSRVADLRSDSEDGSEEEGSGSEVVNFVRNLLARAIDLGVSDIHVEPFRGFSRVRYRIDGVLQEQTDTLVAGYSASSESSFLHENYRAVVARLKIMSNLDISERRLPQDGAISFKRREKTVDMRVSVLPTHHGERVVLRLLDKSAIDMSLDSLGFDERSLQLIKSAVDASQGMVLVTGPTGSGKTTTQYAAIQRINRPDINVLTVEDPVEYNLDGVSQVQVKEDIGLTFSAALRSFLRQDPEVILVGEIRDRETVDIAIKSSLTGHLVLSTLHTNDAVSTIVRLVNMGIEPYLIASSVTLIVAQRLVRRVCQECKEIDNSVTESHLLSIGFSAEEVNRVKVYKGAGCDKCGGRGVKGRRGVYEVFRVNQDIQSAILANASAPEIEKIAIKSGFKPMDEVAREMLRAGDIDFSEFNRVMVV